METNYEPVYIKIHFWKYCGILLLVWGLLIALLLFMQHGDFFMRGRFKYIGFFAVYILAPIAIITIILPPALWLLWRIFYIRKPLLIISKEGFTDNSSFWAFGFIAWKEVKNIRFQTPSPPIMPFDLDKEDYSKHFYIEIVLKNKKKIIKKLSFFKQIYIKWVNIFGEHSGLDIYTLIFKTPSVEVLQTMLEYKAEYDRIHKAKKINKDV